MSKKRRMVASVLAIVLVAALLLGLCGSLVLALAADSGSIQAEIDSLQSQSAEIQQKKADLQAEIESNRGEAKSVVTQKSEIDRSVELTHEEISNIEAQMQEYNRLIASKQEELDGLLEEEADRSAQYKVRLRAMEENGTKVSYWEVLFNSTSFSDLLDRMEMIQEIEESDQQMLEKLKQSAQKVAASREELAAEKVALAEKKDELAQAQQTLDEHRKEADALLQELSANISNMEDEVSNFESMEDELVNQIAAKEVEYKNALAAEEAERRRQEEERRQQASNNDNSNNNSNDSNRNDSNDNSNDNSGNNNSGGVSSSGFMYPLPAGTSYVSCAYGYRIHPVNGNYSFHTGVDLAAAGGTPIYASRSGTVTTATYSDVYGYYVTINHGDGFSTLYGHMTYYTVSSGQYVSQGQVIGYVGTTGWSTGNHLHFTIYYNGSTVNPMNYITVV